ncbi:hypothetical protein BC830DRAFT_1101010 [Chytriomyces sp. MP71]|nr:hypothetical protein BC830DRAFT_1101010 [Chytriomyces sp. MP71]
MSNFAVHPILGRKVVGRPTPCDPCRSKRRKCNLARPECSRCTVSGLRCSYRTGSVLTPQTHHPQTPNATKTVVEVHRAHSAQTSDLRVESLAANQSVDDFALAVAFLSHEHTLNPLNKSDSPVLYLLDADQFMRNFYSVPLHLRLTVCAVAAYNAGLPKRMYLGYYNRAKWAVLGSITRPSVAMLQSLFLIAHFMMVHGQPSVGRDLIVTAVAMAITMDLGHDPDNLLDLTEPEKMEHRRIFWRLYFHIKYAKCVGELRPYTLSLHDMKPPARGVRGGDPIIFHACAIWDLIYAIELQCEEPPASLENLLLSPDVLQLNSLLLMTHTNVPSYYILAPNLSEIADQNAERNLDALAMQYDAFIVQLMTTSPTDTSTMLALSLNLNASICLLLRPKLYITSFMAPDSPLLKPEFTILIEFAIEECCAAALRIAELNHFILHLMDNDTPTPIDPALPNAHVLSKAFWMQQIELSHAVFEAAIVLWIIGSRTHRIWFDRVLILPSLGTVTMHLQGILRFFVQLSRRYDQQTRAGEGDEAFAAAAAGKEDGKPNMATPFIHCITGMLHELSLVEMHGGPAAVRKDSPGDYQARAMDRIVLDMKSMAILAEGEEEVEVARIESDPPVAYLGLLGLEVDDRFRWKSRIDREDKWRSFWNENCI